MSYGDVDELSFGDDREPRWETWARAHRRLLAVVAAAVVLVAGFGVGGAYLYERSLLPSPPPDAPFPQVDSVHVVPCLLAGPGCDHATVQEVLAQVTAFPELTAVAMVQEEAATQKLRDTAIQGGNFVEPGDVRSHGHITARLRDPGDLEAVLKRLTRIPGVSHAYPHARDFWSGKAHLAVLMCGPGLGFDSCDDSYATSEQRDAVVARLWRQDGVEEIFLEDRPFAMRLAQHQMPGERFMLDSFAETLYVRFDDPAKARKAGEAVIELPGVGWGRLVE
jgi:hypothetical protein